MENQHQYQITASKARVRATTLPVVAAEKRYPKNREYFFGKEFELSLVRTAMEELGITVKWMAS